MTLIPPACFPLRSLRLSSLIFLACKTSQLLDGSLTIPLPSPLRFTLVVFSEMSAAGGRIAMKNIHAPNMIHNEFGED